MLFEPNARQSSSAMKSGRRRLSRRLAPTLSAAARQGNPPVPGFSTRAGRFQRTSSAPRPPRRNRWVCSISSSFGAFAGRSGGVAQHKLVCPRPRTGVWCPSNLDYIHPIPPSFSHAAHKVPRPAKDCAIAPMDCLHTPCGASSARTFNGSGLTPARPAMGKTGPLSTLNIINTFSSHALAPLPSLSAFCYIYIIILFLFSSL